MIRNVIICFDFAPGTQRRTARCDITTFSAAATHLRWNLIVPTRSRNLPNQQVCDIYRKGTRWIPECLSLDDRYSLHRSSDLRHTNSWTLRRVFIPQLSDMTMKQRVNGNMPNERFAFAKRRQPGGSRRSLLTDCTILWNVYLTGCVLLVFTPPPGQACKPP